MDGYFEWLSEKIELNTKHTDYTLLVTKLYRTPYVIVTDLEVDAIRIRKARELRVRSGEDIDDSYTVSCLEVLVSIAMDAESKVMKDSEYGDRTAEWFWIMIDNLGLSKFTDDNYNKYDVEEKLARFVNRQYHKNGKGSIAYTKNPGRDFRKLDVWQQFNIFLAENYISA